MTTTSAPSAATVCAAAAPIPVAPPTTSTRLPSYRNASNPVMCPPVRSETSAVNGVQLLRTWASDDEDVDVADGFHVLSSVAAVDFGQQTSRGPHLEGRRGVLGIPRPVRGAVAGVLRSALYEGRHSDVVVLHLLGQDPAEG